MSIIYLDYLKSLCLSFKSYANNIEIKKGKQTKGQWKMHYEWHTVYTG